MIRRGLQFALVVSLLGAAPLFGQAFPSEVVLQNFPVSSTYGVADGYYVEVGQVGAGGGTLYQRYVTETNSNPNMMMQIRFFTNSSTWSVILQNSFNGATLASKGVVAPATNFPVNSFVGGWAGTTGFAPTASSAAIFPSVSDPYDEAFPDWESAAVKIPLGFTFAMSFWAAAVALSIGMKWVKDLASAAS